MDTTELHLELAEALTPTEAIHYSPETLAAMRDRKDYSTVRELWNQEWATALSDDSTVDFSGLL
jgi:hypothetical protein